MWTEIIGRSYPDHETFPPATPAHLADGASALGIALPEPLRELLLESDGVNGADGLGLVWPIGRIVKDNLEFRSFPDFAELYMPFDPLLFFADAGNGDQFAFRILAGAVRHNDVFLWNHEDDSRSWVAPDLQRYLEWWADGRIAT